MKMHYVKKKNPKTISNNTIMSTHNLSSTPKYSFQNPLKKEMQWKRQCKKNRNPILTNGRLKYK